MLVVDVTNFSDETNFHGSRENLHVVLRLKRDNANTLSVQFTAEDPTTWTRAWTAAFPLRKAKQPMYEYACHEGNARSVEGILRAAAVQRQ